MHMIKYKIPIQPIKWLKMKKKNTLIVPVSLPKDNLGFWQLPSFIN